MTQTALLPRPATVTRPSRPQPAITASPGTAARAGRVRASLVVGPAFVAAIAYLDPGNFATNFRAGASYGYRLMWVVLAANLVAVPIQYLSAKLGIVTGRSLPQLCRQQMGPVSSRALWLQAEAVAMATDVAEFVGAAVGLNLLFHMPLPVAGVTTAGLSLGVLAMQRRGHRPFEVAIGALMALICLGFLYETLRTAPSTTQSLRGLLPRLSGDDSVLLAVSIVGATVMPHAVYLHSGLTSGRPAISRPADRRRVLRLQKVDIGVALGIAGLVNLSMLAVAAKVFHHLGPSAPITLQGVHAGLGRLAGGGAALAFAVALLASGISSSSVGTCAGQVIMEGFLRRRLAPWIRRIVTMAPACVLLCTHVNPTQALVVSQVVLSFGIPFALVPLIRLTSSRRLMGEHANSKAVIAVMGSAVVVICGLNLFLLAQQL